MQRRETAAESSYHSCFGDEVRRLENQAKMRLGWHDAEADSPPVVLRIVERLPDGAMAVHSEGPQPCIQRGQIPEKVIEILETLVEPLTVSP